MVESQEQLPFEKETLLEMIEDYIISAGMAKSSTGPIGDFHLKKVIFIENFFSGLTQSNKDDIIREN